MELRRILIIKPSSLGDVATTLPMLCDIKAALPEAEVDWVVHPSFADLLRGHDALREIILFDRKRLGPWWRKWEATKELLGLRRRLREGNYDCVIDAQGLLRSGILTKWTGAKMRVGFAEAREGASWFYTHRVEVGTKRVAVERMRCLLKPLGIASRSTGESRLPVRPEAIEKVEKLIGNTDEVCIVIPGARWDTKRWAADRFAVIATRLCQAGQRVVLVGSPGEKALCNEVADKCRSGGGEVLNLAGATSLAEMVAVLNRARVVVGNDSGPLHVAVALGRKVVGVYGPTDPEFVGPFGQMENVLYANSECGPCRNKVCADMRCTKDITIEQVWAKTREVAELA